MGVQWPEPVSAKIILRDLKARLDAFEVSFRGGLSDSRRVTELWEKVVELEKECQRFHRFLINYLDVLTGVLWAHFPEEYQKIYPRLRELQSRATALIESVEASSPSSQPRTMLEVAEHILLDRGNQPISIPRLIEEMRRRGVNFTAKEPAKSLAQTMRNSRRFETVRRGMYRLVTE